ncbi:uncharacterized protein LOC132543295 [Ylistrum balloti]|uniref:uncharacterized protein LOC132543295 n=1 Tax=Ylistrum balloti TaxID=509963 RepID=UPI002905DFEA|nr:uncharacterized protein LOC132543295 [Ylistrum balloti]
MEREGSLATICYETNYNYGFERTELFMCGEDEYCCGTQRNRECCEEEDVTGIIIGCVVGLVILIIVVIVVICLLKNCNGVQKGVTINPYPNGMTGGVVMQPQQYQTICFHIFIFFSAPVTRMQPLTGNYIMPPAQNNTAYTVQSHIAPPINAESNDVPPPFNYIPPQHVMWH